MERRFSPPTTPWRSRRADHAYGLGAKPDWRGVDWGAQLGKVEVDGTPINYVDLGSGEREPVVFVHGLGGQWQNWLENLPRVAQERRVLALDLPGFGLTPEPRQKITIPWYGRCVEAFCERLDLGQVAVVGNSMGGFVAAEVAIQFPQRVSRLVLVSAAGISSTNVRRRPILLAGRVAAAIITNTAARHRAVAARPIARHLSPLAFVARYPKLLRADLVYEGLVKGAGKPGFDDALRANLDYDFTDRLPEVGVPTLIIWGENDTIIPVSDANEFERLIPDSRKVVMQETGHIPMAERPQAFNDLLMDFLAETGAAEEQEAVAGEAQVA
jgi:pimeloyl-ACP methyl ester carboxylesterase